MRASITPVCDTDGSIGTDSGIPSNLRKEAQFNECRDGSQRLDGDTILLEIKRRNQQQQRLNIGRVACLRKHIIFLVAMLLNLFATMAVSPKLLRLSDYQQYEGRLLFSHPKPHSNKTATLCAVVKDQQLKYIDEWADYHMALGFTGMRIYDNTDDFALKDWGKDKPYSDQIKLIHFLPDVTHNITRFPGCKSEAQSAAYMDCVKASIKQNVNWVAGFDMDEFLVLRNSTSIVDFLDEYCKFPCVQISFNWLMFGSSNRNRYVPVPVTKRFPYRVKSNLESIVKGIADPRAVDQSSYWVHTFPLKASRQWKDTSGRIFNAKPGERWKMLINSAKPQDVAVLHHYKTLSEEEWHYKNCIRKGVNGNDMRCGGKKASEELPASGGMIYDDTAWQILRDLVPSYRMYDSVEDLG